MARLALGNVCLRLKEKRSSKGMDIREAAKEIGISPATLSRIENGSVPDIGTFSKICKWMQIDPNEVLDCGTAAKNDPSTEPARVQVHFRAEKIQDPDVARALTEMILKAQSMILEDNQGLTSEGNQ